MFKEFFEFDGGEVEESEETSEETVSEETTESKVFVPEKISETEPTLWKQVSGITSLEEIYNVALELCEAGDWQTALNMSIELITAGGIKDAEGWNDDQITSWFNTNVLKKGVRNYTGSG